MNQTSIKLQLRKNEELRLRKGHLWVFSNEIDTLKTPFKNCEPGATVQLYASNGASLGIGYINPHSLVAVRLWSSKSHLTIDQHFFLQRCQKALAYRHTFYHAPYYRLIYGESDGLPGLIVDRYDSIAVVQITTAGMERYKNIIIDVLRELGFKTIYLRNTTRIRLLEQLDLYNELAVGELPEKIQLYENNIPFQVSLTEGQKTGWFYDHRENRAFAGRFAKDRRVLDVFSYVGGWGIQLLAQGAKQATFIDSSATACEFVRANAQLNAVEQKTHIICDDAFNALTQLQGETFDLIVLDPPAFIKRKKDSREGQKAYHRLNQLAMKLLAPGGIIVSASCSMHLAMNELSDIVDLAALKNQHSLRRLAYGYQGFDHPIHPVVNESCYLKAITSINVTSQ